jgi:hypothetical protein
MSHDVNEGEGNKSLRVHRHFIIVNECEEIHDLHKDKSYKDSAYDSSLEDAN